MKHLICLFTRLNLNDSFIFTFFECILFFTFFNLTKIIKNCLFYRLSLKPMKFKKIGELNGEWNKNVEKNIIYLQ